MTMRLEISNKDDKRILRVIQRDKDSPVVSQFTDIAPGKSAEFYVWSTRELVLNELEEEK
jgi:hypothetical protein